MEITPAFSGKKAAIQVQVMKKPESGFSVLELVIVLAVFLIVAAMAVPSMRRVMDEYRLKASGRDVANMLQQTRMLAVQSNQPYYVQVNGGNNTQASAQSAIQLAGGPAPPSNPTVFTAASVPFQGAGLPNHVQLDNFVGGTPPPAQINGVIGFSARGIPCGQGVVPGNAFNCSPNTTGFEWFMQSTASNTWEAVTVTPAGRIRSWRETSNGNWQ